MTGQTLNNIKYGGIYTALSEELRKLAWSIQKAAESFPKEHFRGFEANRLFIDASLRDMKILHDELLVYKDLLQREYTE